MPEFNRKYTYGTGHFHYTLRLDGEGNMYIDGEQIGVRLSSPAAIRFHITEVTSKEGFRYL